MVQRWCSGGAAVVQRWCSGGAVVAQRWCSGGAAVVQRWCSGGAAVVQRWCRGAVSQWRISAVVHCCRGEKINLYINACKTHNYKPGTYNVL